MVLSSSKVGKRKRSRQAENTSSDKLQSDTSNAFVYDDDANPSLGGPLEGVIACLSGFAQHTKDDLHRLILSLGGRYTRELNLDKNTHLVTETAKGAKFELAVSSNPRRLHIVTPSWVNSASESGQRARETDHGLELTIKSSEENRNCASNFSKDNIVALMNDALREALVTKVGGGGGSDLNLSRSFLFKNLQFYLIGFEGNPGLKQKISKLIRCGNGTIHWEMNDDISMLLLCDRCDDALRKAARVITAHHSNFPPMVSPLWVIESYKHGTLQSVSAYPTGEDTIKSKMKGSQTYPKTSSLSSTTSNVSIFRGCLFSLVRTSTPIVHVQSKVETSDNVEFDTKNLESLIKTHGGQTLSVKLLGALRADGGNTDGFSKRKCHVVCWGESPPRLDTNPLISQLERHNLCEIILVTPIWVQACVSSRKCLKPEYMPLVLMPQLWPMKSVIKVPVQPQQIVGNREKKLDFSNNQSQSHRRLQIALTDFQGTEKEIIVHLINAIGGVYHDNMSDASTHLVFKKHPNRLKLEKANEWGLCVVSIQWLYHVMKYGYGGVQKEELGCEKRFSFSAQF